MRPDLFFILLALVAVSCSGPQMIASPQTDTSATPAKKTEENAKETVKTEISDESGVFDDEKFKLKVDLQQWKLIDDEDGIQTYEKTKSDSGLVAFRGEVFIAAPLKKVATVLVDDSLQKEWVDSFVETRNISTKNEFEHIEYNQTKVPWPFQNRDFVFKVLARVNVQPPTMLITMKSLEDPAAPPVNGIVRGEIVHSYYYLKETPAIRGTKMVVEMEVDPKGAIPMWLVKLSQKGWPHNTLAAVKRLSLRDDIQILPKLEKYFEIPKVKEKKKGKKK